MNRCLVVMAYTPRETREGARRGREEHGTTRATVASASNYRMKLSDESRTRSARVVLLSESHRRRGLGTRRRW